MELDQIATDVTTSLAKSDKAIDKAIEGLGMLFPYVGLRKKALDMYIEDVEKSNMPRETKMIAILNAKDTIKKLKRQKKVAEIAINNTKDGTDFSEKSGVSQEWLERFMDSAGFVSDETVQLMWGKILAQEFEKPGNTPPNMIRILSEMTPEYAQAFRKICSMRLVIGELDVNNNVFDVSKKIAIPYETHSEQLDQMGLSFKILNELDTLGIIKFDAIVGFATISEKATKLIGCVDGDSQIIIEHDRNHIPTGNVILTLAGRCLMNITDVQPIGNYKAMIMEYMQCKSIYPVKKSDFVVISNENTTEFTRNKV